MHPLPVAVREEAGVPRTWGKLPPVCRKVPMDYLTDTVHEYDTALRVIRDEATPGFFVNLITNLSDHGFDMESIREFYHLRWEEENSCQDVKYPLCLRALHSKKYRYVVQGIWARVILP